MIIQSGQQTIMKPNATVLMSDGDHLSICYTDKDGKTLLVHIAARAIALVIKDQNSGNKLFL